MSLRILLAAVTLLALPACLEQERVPSPTLTRPTSTTLLPTTSPPTPADVAVARFSVCMSDNGLAVEPVPFDGMGRPRLDWFLADHDLTDPGTITALSACASHLGTGALDLTDEPEIREMVVTTLQEFSECVRARGVPDFPDPVDGFNGLGAPYPMAEIPYADPDLGEAAAECRERLPAP